MLDCPLLTSRSELESETVVGVSGADELPPEPGSVRSYSFSAPDAPAETGAIAAGPTTQAATRISEVYLAILFIEVGALRP